MSRQAQITGVVKYRHGDGPRSVIPQGTVTIEETATDVTLSWSADDNTSQSAAIPQTEFKRYVAEHKIELH